MIANKIQSALTVGLGVAAFAATVPVAHAQDAGGLEEVFVTARKRDEGAQTVPVSMAALSAETLEQRNVRDVQDLNVVVPGFHFGAEGGKATNNIIMRGLSRIPLGEGVPAVVTYFANVALPGSGSNIPTYDIANVQVLKGPQGTLFGRNTLGGAVVITPEAPSYEFGGYLRGAYGTKDYRSVEGAVNVPIVDDKVALRISGQLRRQDGLANNLNGGDDFDDIHQNSYRISLLLQPTDNIQSTTVYDHFQAKEAGSNYYLFRANEPALAGIALGFNNAPQLNQLGVFNAGDQIAQQIRNYVAQSRAAGVHNTFSDFPNADPGSANRKLWGVSNDTSVDLGWATVRNILGYRRIDVFEAINSAGVGPISVDVAPGVSIPFTTFHAGATTSRSYLSDELQLFGTAWNDRLDWITGLYYNKDKAADPMGSTFTSFNLGQPVVPVTSSVTNRNKAIFAQTGWDISEWTVDGLKFTAGARYSWDDVWACGGGNPAGTGYMSTGECKSIANSGNPNDGVGIVKNNGGAPSWTIGLDWQITPDTLLYAVTRRGYRGVNVNTPLFETPYTTGQSHDCLQGTLQCPDLRQFQKTDKETLTDYEIGVKNDWRIGDVKGRANVSAYISKYKNALQFLNAQQDFGLPQETQDVPTNGSVGANIADLNIWGVEADFTVVPVPSLTLTLSGAYTHETVDKFNAPVGYEMTKDNVTLPSPKFTGTFGFNWTLPTHPLDGDVVFSGDYYYTDKFSGQWGENLPSYELANFRLGWMGIAKSGLDVALYVKNAFDKEYFSAPDVLLPAFPVGVVVAGDPRTWGVEATYKF